MFRRQEQENNGKWIKALLFASIFVGFVMMILGVVFRVYVCHWVAKGLFAIWIGIIVSIRPSILYGKCSIVLMYVVVNADQISPNAFGLLGYGYCTDLTIGLDRSV